MNQFAQEMEKATSDRARDLVAALNDPNQSTIIETKMDKRGGFYAANVSNRTIEYAYPSSIHATAAVKNPAKVAERMLHGQAHIQRETEQPQWFLDRWSHMRAAMLAA